MVAGGENHEEQLNVYDSGGRVTGAAPRSVAKASGQAVGAVNVLLLDATGAVLLQQRPADKENGGRWDKSAGGHVGAGEDFDETALRETGEELFDDGASLRVRLLPGAPADRWPDPADGVVLRRVGLQLNLRDVRRAPDGRLRNVLYHVAIYFGRTALPISGFRPQASEIAGLRYATPAEVDDLLLLGELAPNMAFLWLSQGHALLSGAGQGR